MKIQADLERTLQFLINRWVVLEARVWALEARILQDEGVPAEEVPAAIAEMRATAAEIEKDMKPTWQLALAKETGLPSGWLSALLSSGAPEGDEPTAPRPPEKPPGQIEFPPGSDPDRG